jgi:predicted O-methyltransferase YrrM
VPALADFVLGNHFFGAFQLREELVGLGEILAARRPECALEIGTARGGTLFFLTRLASPHATIVSVDLPGGPFGGGYPRRRALLYEHFARRDQAVHLLRGDSHSSEMLNGVKAALGGQALDYLFIDGDHSYAGVKRDFEMYAPLVGRGGLIVFHDIADGPQESVGGVPKFWQELRGGHHYGELIRDPKQGSGGLGMIYVD